MTSNELRSKALFKTIGGMSGLARTRVATWPQNFRHILVRHDYYAENFLGFVQLGCMMILLRRCL